MKKRNLVLFSALFLLLTIPGALGVIDNPIPAEKREHHHENKLHEITDEEIYNMMHRKLRFIIYYDDDDISDEKMEELQKFADEIHEDDTHIVIGYHICDDQHFECREGDDHEAGDVLPKMKLYDRRRYQAYNQKSGETFHQFVRRVYANLTPYVHIIRTEENLQDLYSELQYSVIGHIHPGSEDNELLMHDLREHSRQHSSYHFAIGQIEGKKILEKHPEFKEYGIYMVGNDPDGYTYMRKCPFPMENHEEALTHILAWIEVESTPPVIFYSDVYEPQLVRGLIRYQVFVFTYNKDSAEIKRISHEMVLASRHDREHGKYMERMNFLIYDLNENSLYRKNFDELNEGDMYITDISGHHFHRYKFPKPASEINKDSILEFIQQFRAGEAEEFHLSEDDHSDDVFIPNTNILMVTGAQYTQKIIHNDDPYFVVFCGEVEGCDHTVSIVKFFASKVQDPSKLRFAYVNRVKNNVAGIHPEHWPGYVLHVGPLKENPLIFPEKESSYLEITKWINEQLGETVLEVTAEEIFDAFYWSRPIEERVDLWHNIMNGHFGAKTISREYALKVAESDTEAFKFEEQNNQQDL